MWITAPCHVEINAQVRGASINIQSHSLVGQRKACWWRLHVKMTRKRVVRTVSGSPCSACRMKLLTTRPSFMCILEPKVLKILATLTSTPSCKGGKITPPPKKKHRKHFIYSFNYHFYPVVWAHRHESLFVVRTKRGTKHRPYLVHVHRNINSVIFEDSREFVMECQDKWADPSSFGDRKTAYGLQQHDQAWAAHMPPICR